MEDIGANLFDFKKFDFEEFLLVAVEDLGRLAWLLEIMAVHVLVPVVD